MTAIKEGKFLNGRIQENHTLISVTLKIDKEMGFLR